jgi:2-amino-4-hydroxy-6-hydroxymethyldihydropteridine diphosphokinase
MGRLRYGARVDERVFVAVGTNLGDRLGNVVEARRRLQASPAVQVVATSPLLETPALLLPHDLPQPDFLNGVFELRTTLEPGDLLTLLLAVERSMGRVRTTRWAPRVIDLDLVLFGSRVVEGGRLTVPHPGLASRRFVLEPLASLAPEVRHPVTGRRIDDLNAALR